MNPLEHSIITTSIISGIRQWQHSSMPSLPMIPVVCPNSLSLYGQEVDIHFTKHGGEVLASSADQKDTGQGSAHRFYC